MNEFEVSELKKLYVPHPSSHKGENGKLLVIGGSHLFHAASLWSLTIASRILDMVFYSSVPENNAIVHELKKEFRNGIIVPREQIESYIDEAECVLIGPGMVRSASHESPHLQSLAQLENISDEGLQTRALSQFLFTHYPDKKWVIDAGSLQMIDPEWLHALKNVILTPHPKEFTRLFHVSATAENVEVMAKKYHCVILLKGQEDTVCNGNECVRITGGNAGMTKGGTGDVLAGLIASLACKNDIFLAAKAGSFLNKKAGESLAETMGLYFNASDLCEEIPRVMKKLIF